MYANHSLPNIVMPAEWERQDAIIVAWPHLGTDWGPMLDEAHACFMQVAKEIVKNQRLVIVAPAINQLKQKLSALDNDMIIYQEIETNDTWARDFAPISIIAGNERRMLDFKFDAWGMKFAAFLDNLISRRMAANGIFDTQFVNCQDFVLEGGSIESDGKGTLLTTSRCLLSPNRNSALTQQQIEDVLHTRLGVHKVLWLNHGELKGDDTDAHIDTLARFAPGNTILYVSCDNPYDEQYHSLKLMEEELKSMTNAQGEPFKLVPLPSPNPIFDDNRERLPATYANFLITNEQVLVPIYGQSSNDQLALDTIQQVFDDRDIVGIDCNALIKQHGSLHCITMQIPENFLNK